MELNKINRKVAIYYCVKCKWLMRAAWMGQELLSTFEDELEELSLKPGRVGQFEIYVNEKSVFNRKREGRFPELKEVKQLVRDIIAPEKNLGHSEGKDGR